MRKLVLLVLALTQLALFVPAAEAAPIWMLRNAHSAGGAHHQFAWGNASGGWQPVAGDWLSSSDGMDTAGQHKDGNWYLRHGNGADNTSTYVSWGNIGWKAVPARWASDFGGDLPGVFRSDGLWRIRPSVWSSAHADFWYGDDGDKPVAAHRSLFGVVRGSTWLMCQYTSCASQSYLFTFGLASDVPLLGNWDGAGSGINAETPGLYRPSESRFLLSNSPTGATVDYNYVFGLSGDKPVVGDWDGNGADTVGVVRGM